MNKALMFMGWTVIRFWGKDILKNCGECIRVIEECIFELSVQDDRVFLGADDECCQKF